MKKLRYSILLILISGFLGVSLGFIKNTFSEETSRVYAQMSAEYDGFDNALEEADLIVVGEIKDIVENREYDEFNIDICKVEKGDIQKKLHIRNYLYNYSYTYNGTKHTGQTNCNYKEGEKYLFVLQHIDNVYEDRYVILCDIYIPISEYKLSTAMAEPIDNIENPVEYVEDYTFENETGKGDELSIEYIKSSQLDTIVDKSAYIAVVSPKELYRQTDVVDVYLCDVVEVLKGKINVMEQSQIIIPFFKDTVSIDTNYVTHLNTDTDGAYIYFLSSKNSVYHESKKEEIMAMLEKKFETEK